MKKSLHSLRYCFRHHNIHHQSIGCSLGHILPRFLIIMKLTHQWMIQKMGVSLKSVIYHDLPVKMTKKLARKSIFIIRYIQIRTDSNWRVKAFIGMHHFKLDFYLSDNFLLGHRNHYVWIRSTSTHISDKTFFYFDLYLLHWSEYQLQNAFIFVTLSD